MKDFNSGIYKIENIVTGDLYIGSSANLERRWARHRTNLRTNKHHNIILQRAWNKYGEESLRFSIIELANAERLLLLEQQYIHSEKPCYNIASDATAPMRGRQHKPESIELIRASSTGRTWSATDEAKCNMRTSALQRRLNKPVIAIEPSTGEVKHRFETIGDVADLGWKKSAVIRCCKGKMQSYQGFLWKYENDADAERDVREVSAETRAKLSAGRTGKAHSLEVREKIAEAHEWKPVASFNPITGEIIKRYARMRAVEDDGFAQCRVWVCCQGLTKKGKIPKHGGFGWKYLT